MNTIQNIPGTVQAHVAALEAKFAKLSKSRQATLCREARAFIRQNPGAADHSNFWGGRAGLSARQVLAV